MEKQIRTAAIIGSGALGLLYGSRILTSESADLRYIVDGARYERNRRLVYTENGKEIPVKFVRESEARPVDLVIVAVKYPGLESALEQIGGFVGEDTILLSVMNGISSEEMLGERYGSEKLIYCVAQGMDAMRFGSALRYTKAGELRIGILSTGKKENLRALEDFLERSGISYTEETDIRTRIWGKFMLNVGINQTCMVYNTDYGTCLKKGTEENRIFLSAMREVITVANAENIALSESDLNDYVRIIGTLSPKGMPSMAQDRINRKPSEVDAFSGALIRLARKHGIEVPVNHYLNRRAKEIEASYLG